MCKRITHMCWQKYRATRHKGNKGIFCFHYEVCTESRAQQEARHNYMQEQCLFSRNIKKIVICPTFLILFVSKLNTKLCSHTIAEIFNETSCLLQNRIYWYRTKYALAMIWYFANSVTGSTINVYAHYNITQARTNEVDAQKISSNFILYLFSLFELLPSRFRLNIQHVDRIMEKLCCSYGYL